MTKPGEKPNPQPKPASACLSAAVLDELVEKTSMGEMLTGDLAKAERHTSRCKACGDRLMQRFGGGAPSVPAPAAAPAAALKVKTAEEAVLLPADMVKEEYVPWYKTKLGIGLVAAAVLIVVGGVGLMGGGQAQTVDDGAPPFRTYVTRGDEVLRGKSGANYYPGDILGFRYSSKEPWHVAAFAVGETGEVTTLVPSESEQSIAMDPGEDVELPAAAELGPSQGKERMVQVFCAETFGLTTVSESLHSLPNKPQLNGTDVGLDGHCIVRTFIMEKKPAPTP